MNGKLGGLVAACGALVLVASWPTAAGAQADDASPIPVVVAPQLPDDVTPPKRIGGGSCPMKIAKAIAVVAFTVEPDGSVKYPDLMATTGYRDLNDIAKNCVSGWIYKPAMKDGKPVEVRKIVIFQFYNLGPPSIWVPPPADGAPHVCTARTPSTGKSIGMIVSLRDDGGIRQITILHPSGDPAFDAYAVTCVETWRYQSPASTGSPNYDRVGLPAGAEP
ncbi:MAG TPA: energy transducer TonB [Rhizomicrobium sp.]|nr:energy transducer TonB [Rhizomicrobium sp.]